MIKFNKKILVNFGTVKKFSEWLKAVFGVFLGQW